MRETNQITTIKKTPKTAAIKPVIHIANGCVTKINDTLTISLSPSTRIKPSNKERFTLPQLEVPEYAGIKVQG